MEKMLEIGDAGFYSPVPLSKYKITHPVWNFGFGLGADADDSLW